MELSHRPSLSNVTLQMVLYFNAILSILYAVVLGAVATEKSLAYHRNTPIVALFLWIIIEPARLFLGITGNLSEKVIELSM